MTCWKWKFLSEKMKHMGFYYRWIGWIMTCVSAVRYSVLVNGTQEVYITPARWLRQRDSLSPYLFILCAEVLSHLMTQAIMNRSLTGVKISNNAPAINHLLFTDDSLFSHWKMRRQQKTEEHLWDLWAVSVQAIKFKRHLLHLEQRSTTRLRRRREVS